jgi:O-antigen ligase
MGPLGAASKPWVLVVALAIVIAVAVHYPLVGLGAAALVAAAIALGTGLDVSLLAVIAFVAITGLNLTDVLTDRYDAPSLAKPLMVAILALIGVEAVRRWRLPELDPVGAGAVVLFVAAAGVSVMFAYRTETAFEAYSDLIKNAAIALAIGLLVADRLSLRSASVAFLAAMSAIGAIATYQVLTGSYDEDFLGFGRADFLHIAGATDSYRILGPFSDPNSFARVLLLAIPLAIYELFHSRAPLGRALAGVGLSLLLLALIFTYSRGALVGLAVTLAPLAYRMRQRWRLLVALTAILAVLFTLFAPTTLWDRLGAAIGLIAGPGSDLHQGDESIGNRLDEMMLAIRMFAENPALGVGLGNYQELFQQYAIEATAIFRHEDRQAHSRFLEVAAEQGLVGIVAFVGLLWVAFSNLAAAAADRLIDEAGRDLAFAMLLALASYLTASIFLHDDYPRYFWLFIGMAIAVPTALRSA